MGVKGIKYTQKMVEEHIFLRQGIFEVLLKGNMNKNFKVELCSDLEYEEMVIYISYQDNTLAILNQENGVENIEIKITSPPKGSSWNFKFDDFLEILLFSKRRLEDAQKKE